MATERIEQQPEHEGGGEGLRPGGWRGPLAAPGIYLLAIVGATWPFATSFASRIPSAGDPLQHLWVMRWYKQCLMEGRSPLVCPDLNYPVGASIGNFSPLHLQSALYLVFSSFVDNDALCFNLIWLSGLLLTGMGTFALARHVLRDDGGATLAGLLAMLSGPVLVHSRAHLELIFVGGFPLFLLAWMRFVDRPSLARMAAAAGGFVLVAMCAAYFMVFAIFPAGLYLAWAACRRPRGEVLAWIKVRAGWLIGFSAACLPVLMVLFAGQLWNAMNGQAGIRPRAEFDRYGAPWWAYLVPTSAHRAQGFLPVDVYAVTRTSGEGMAYLGVVTLALVARAGLGGVRFRDSGFWWLSAGLLVVLSLGSAVTYGPHRIGMPAGWLRDWDWFVPFRLIRVPARFKLFVPVCTGIIAGAAWMSVRRGLAGRPAAARLALAGLMAVAVLDLGWVPYGSEAIPALPGGYAWIRDRDPEAAWVDVPQMNSGNADPINSKYTYWQSLHGGRTTAGYSGHQNRPFDDLLSWNSPFADYRMVEAGFPGPDGSEHFDLTRCADFRDYAWLYLTRHDLRYVVLHRREGRFQVDRVAELLEGSKCYDDGELAVFDRELMPEPDAPVAMGTEGWGGFHLIPDEGFVRLATRSSALAFDNPEPSEPLVLAFEAKALGAPRRVSLTDGQSVLWTWEVAPEAYDLYVSPPFLMDGRRGELRLESDGALPREKVRKRFEGERHPASMIVRAVCLRWASGAERRSPGVLASGLAREWSRVR